MSENGAEQTTLDMSGGTEAVLKERIRELERELAEARAETTLSQARNDLRDTIYPLNPATGERELGKGMRCPACTQNAQVYKWSLYGSAIRMLIAMYRVGGTDEFVESKTVKKPGEGGHTSQLSRWELVEHEPDRRPDGGKSGWWRVTPLGKRFIFREATVPEYVYTFDGKVLRRFGRQVTIDDCLTKKFNYDEMMAGLL